VLRQRHMEDEGEGEGGSRAAGSGSLHRVEAVAVRHGAKVVPYGYWNPRPVPYVCRLVYKRRATRRKFPGPLAVQPRFPVIGARYYV
jgi:hypothetical protein